MTDNGYKDMASIKEIVKIEGERSEPDTYKRVHLFHEGSFLRAYEWSAWLLCHYVHEFKVTRRQYKGIEDPVIFIGFPQTSLAKFVPEGCEVTPIEEKHSVMDIPIELNEEEREALRTEYEKWCKSQPIAETSRERQQSNALQHDAPTSITEVMHSVISYPIERKFPIDCMLFLAEIKAQLARLI